MKKILVMLLTFLFCKFVFASEVTCLADTIYNEARSEPLIGQKAVAAVVFNRIKSKSAIYKENTVCATVKKKAQFASGKPAKKGFEREKYYKIRRNSLKWYYEFVNKKFVDPTYGSLLFASRGYIHKGKKKTVKIGGHQFFK
ncbi:hypothetical protein CSB11_01515 [Candidatus Campbellbacteria bacterium]|nr:MAG: hypothetical protein CSB11_01515 [Candidatus Campbellbacteria bacterium]